MTQNEFINWLRGFMGDDTIALNANHINMIREKLKTVQEPTPTSDHTTIFNGDLPEGFIYNFGHHASC